MLLGVDNDLNRDELELLTDKALIKSEMSQRWLYGIIKAQDRQPLG